MHVNKKHFAAIAVAFFIPLQTLADDATYTDSSTGLIFTLDTENKTAAVATNLTSSDYSSTTNQYSTLSGALTIPATITSDGTEYTVTSLPDYCFYGCTGITSVTFGTTDDDDDDDSGVTSIGASCFYKCTALTSITLPDALTSVGEKCFASCTALTSIEIPSKVTSLNNDVFAACI